MKNTLLTFSVLLLFCFNTFSQQIEFNWAKRFGGSENENVNCMAMDANGSFYLGGTFTGTTLTFGSTTLTNSGGTYGGGPAFDFYIAKFDSYGTPIWAKKGGSINAIEKLSAIATDGINSYITGLYNAAMTIGSTNLTNSGGYDAFVIKYDGTGTPLWAQKIGGSGNEMGNGIKVDGSGNSYVIGTFTSNSIFSSPNTLSHGGTGGDVFVVKYNSSGSITWTRKIGGTKDDNGNAITIDASGNSYVIGDFSSTPLTIGSTTLTNSGSNDVFVAKLDASGNPVWSVKGGGTGIDSGTDIEIDASGNVYVTGFFASSTFTMGSYSVNNSGTAGSLDIFYAKINNAGTVQWLKKCGGSDMDNPGGISIDPSGNLYLLGYYAGPSTNLGGTNTINNSGSQYNSDVFIAKIGSAGNVIWVKQPNGFLNEDGWAIAANNAGVVIAGTFNSAPASFGGHSLTSSGKIDIYTAQLGVSNSINEPGNTSDKMIIYPNPAEEKINIELKGNNKGGVLNIYNQLGQILYSKSISANEDFLFLNVSELNTGIYTVVFQSNEFSFHKKLIKK